LIAAMPTLASTRTVVGGMSKKRSENKKLHQRRKARPQSVVRQAPLTSWG
jgi:hypothetical protein